MVSDNDKTGLPAMNDNMKKVNAADVMSSFRCKLNESNAMWWRV